MAGILQVDSLTNSAGTGPVAFPNGINNTGVIAAAATGAAAGQSFTTNGGTIQQVLFNNVTPAAGRIGYNIGGAYSTGNSNFTVPTGYDGLYQISAQVLVDATNILAGFYNLNIQTGATFAGSTILVAGAYFATAGVAFPLSVSATAQLTAGTIVWLGMLGVPNNSASAYHIDVNDKYCYWTITKVG